MPVMEMEGLKTSDYYFDLPKELIAQDPLEDRSASRLLVMDRQTGATSHHIFKEICSFLKPGDCLVLNNTKVIPARLLGAKEDTGAAVEILLLKRMENDVWETLVKPGKKLRPGAKVVFGDGRLRAEILDVEEDGNRLVKFFYDGIWEEVLDSLGEMPLPPYITHKLQDKNRYQTVYAKFEGSAAAPTAGLHFTKELLAQVEAMGAADKINRAKAAGNRVICVGTTSCRTVESAAEADGHMKACSGNTDIFIYPGYKFKVMDGLITNFHLPESTLVMLVSAFAGRDHVLKAYEEAVKEKYRFFSFGDAMFIADLNKEGVRAE